MCLTIGALTIGDQVALFAVEVRRRAPMSAAACDPAAPYDAGWLPVLSIDASILAPCR